MCLKKKGILAMVLKKRGIPDICRIINDTAGMTTPFYSAQDVFSIQVRSLEYVPLAEGGDECPYIQFSFYNAQNQSTGWTYIRPGQTEAPCVTFSNATVIGYNGVTRSGRSCCGLAEYENKPMIFTRIGRAIFHMSFHLPERHVPLIHPKKSMMKAWISLRCLGSTLSIQIHSLQLAPVNISRASSKMRFSSFTYSWWSSRPPQPTLFVGEQPALPSLRQQASARRLQKPRVQLVPLSL
jgi:hypothetical protein